MSIFRSTTLDIQELRAIQTLMYCAPDITEKLKVGAPFSLPEPKKLLERVTITYTDGGQHKVLQAQYVD